MTTPEGIPLTLDEAFGRAADDTGYQEPAAADDLFGSDEAEQAPPPEGEQPSAQPDTPDEQPTGLFDDLVKAEPERVPGEIDWTAQVSLPGQDRPVALGELRDGYLRQADYTRKTQALAAERKALEEDQSQARRLFDSLKEDPVGTAAYLAVSVGLVDEQQMAGKVRSLRDTWKPPPSREEVEAEVDKRVAEQVAQHPIVREAQQQQLLASIERDFARIEQRFQIKLGDRDKAAILKRAVDSQTNDLELVTESMLHRLAKLREGREQATQAAPLRPGVRTPAAETPAEIRTVEDAFNLALAEARAAG